MATLADLTPQSDTENARKHNPRNIGQIVQSLQEVGAARSVVIDEGNHFMAGSGTYEAATQAGIERVAIVDVDGDTLVAVRRSGLTPEQKVRLAIADNRTAETAEWNYDVLLRQTLMTPQIMESMWSTDELAKMFKGMTDNPYGRPTTHGSGGDEFDATPSDGPTRVQPGDVWALGDHLLLCGDSSDDTLVSRLFHAAGCDEAALLVTSPPYGVGKDYEEGGVVEWRKTVNGVFRTAARYSPLWFVNLANRRTGNDGFEANTFGMMTDDFLTMGYGLIATRIWTKPPAWAVAGPYWHHTYKAVDDFEFLGLYAPVDRKPKHAQRLPPDEQNGWGFRGVWDIASVAANREHSAAFPVELPTRAIKMLTDEGDDVYEPFSGSGTTMVACHRLARRALMAELSPAYCDLHIKRAEAEGIGPIRRVS